MHQRLSIYVAFLAITLALLAFAGSAIQLSLVVSEASAQSSVRPPDSAVNSEPTTTAGGSVRPPSTPQSNAPDAPGTARERDVIGAQNPVKAETILRNQGPNSASTVWGEIRSGERMSVSIPDKNAAMLVQDAGMGWLEWRQKGGPLQVYGGYAMLIIIGLLLLFYLLRGRIRIESGVSGLVIERFRSMERFAHWVLAGSFILLALSGLNLLYGKDWILPYLGKEAFATVTVIGKWIHNNVAWAFMFALVLVFLLWVRHNIPGLIDLRWMLKGGGLFSKGSHPPARKFNAGQKIVFWSVIILGASISASGISLLFPFEAPMFAKTFAFLNDIGIGPLVWGEPLPTVLTPIEEMMYAQIWHTIVAFAMIFIIIAHIYIGSVGMEGAFDAMGTGYVDRNWAHEHHGLWVEEEDAKIGQPHPGATATPAE
jgi:formate dehydrogenase subunit gamma